MANRFLDDPRVQRPAPQAQPQQGSNRFTQPEQVSTAEDIVRSAGAGLRRGVEGIPGMPQDIANLAGAGYGWLTGTEQNWDIPYLPSTDDIHGVTSQVIGESYEPQTTAGKYARTAGEFAPALINPTRGAVHVGTQLALGAGAGLASEFAGQMTEGTKYEPWMRAAGGVAGGVAGSSLAEGIKGVASRGRRAAEAATEDAALRHGVRLTKGQRSGDVTQQALEEQMLHGTRGEKAQRLMQERDVANKAAIGGAVDEFAGTVAPNRATDPVHAGGRLNEDIRDRTSRLKQAGSRDIEAAIQSGQMIDADRLRNLPGEIRSNLAGPTPYIPDIMLGPNTPIANEAMERLSTFASQASDPKVKEFSLAGAENLRQRITELSAAPGTADARALGRIRQHFDDWLEGSLPSGSPELDQLRTGRSTYREGARVERPRGNERQDPGAQAVSKMVLSNHPEDTRRLFTPDDRGVLSSQATDALDRLSQTGATKAELDQVRGIVLNQLNAGFPGKRATRIENFIRENPTAARMLFTAQELEDLSGLGRTSRRLVPDPLATNPSRSSYSMLRELGTGTGKALSKHAATVGALVGGLPGAVIGGAAGKAGEFLTGLANNRAALDALSPVDRSTLAELIARGAGKGARRATPAAQRQLQEREKD